MGQRKRAGRASGAATKKEATSTTAGAATTTTATTSASTEDKSTTSSTSPSKTENTNKPAAEDAGSKAPAKAPESSSEPSTVENTKSEPDVVPATTEPVAAVPQGPVYLDFLDEISDLHTEVGRKFQLMKSSDSTASEEFKAARKAMKAFWRSVERSETGKAEEFHRSAEASFALVLANTDEKIAITNDLHASLDRHIRSLTETLNAFHAELEAKGELPQLPEARLPPVDPVPPAGLVTNGSMMGFMDGGSPWIPGPSPLGSSSQLLSPVGSRLGSLGVGSEGLVGNKRKFDEAGLLGPGLTGASVMQEERERKLQRIIEAAKTDSNMKTLLDKIQETASKANTPKDPSTNPATATTATNPATTTTTTAGSNGTADTKSTANGETTSATPARGAGGAAGEVKGAASGDGEVGGGDGTGGLDKASLLDAMDQLTGVQMVSGEAVPLTHEQLAMAAMANAQPGEPLYCLCNRVSFGEMVGCDNPNCEKEWFHFACVGLTAEPKGAWLCPDCAVKKRKK